MLLFSSDSKYYPKLQFEKFVEITAVLAGGCT